MTPTTDPAATRRRPKQRVRLSGVSWATYTRVVRALEGNPGARLAYDRGELEIMAPSFEHEDDAYHLGLFLDILAEELGLPLRRGGSVTLKRKRWKKGVEPDRCFWVANAAQLAGVRQLDLRVHPPPDVAIEVDVSSSSLDRFGIYARLGVGELWRLDGDVLRFHLLGPDRKYAEVAASPTFAGVGPADLMAFVRAARGAADQTIVSKGFREWVRRRAARPAGGEENT